MNLNNMLTIYLTFGFLDEVMYLVLELSHYGILVISYAHAIDIGKPKVFYH